MEHFGLLAPRNRLWGLIIFSLDTSNTIYIILFEIMRELNANNIKFTQKTS
jgi:hypothetical protein